MLYYPVQRISANLEHSRRVIPEVAVEQKQHAEARKHKADDAPPRLDDEQNRRDAEEDFIAERLRSAARNLVEEDRDVADGPARDGREQPVVPRSAQLVAPARRRIKHVDGDDGEGEVYRALNGYRHRRYPSRIEVEQRHSREPEGDELPLPARQPPVAALLVVFFDEAADLGLVHAYVLYQRFVSLSVHFASASSVLLFSRAGEKPPRAPRPYSTAPISL